MARQAGLGWRIKALVLVDCSGHAAMSSCRRVERRPSPRATMSVSRAFCLMGRAHLCSGSCWHPWRRCGTVPLPVPERITRKTRRGQLAQLRVSYSSAPQLLCGWSGHSEWYGLKHCPGGHGHSAFSLQADQGALLTPENPVRKHALILIYFNAFLMSNRILFFFSIIMIIKIISAQLVLLVQKGLCRWNQTGCL